MADLIGTSEGVIEVVKDNIKKDDCDNALGNVDLLNYLETLGYLEFHFTTRRNNLSNTLVKATTKSDLNARAGGGFTVHLQMLRKFHPLIINYLNIQRLPNFHSDQATSKILKDYNKLT